MTADTQLSSTDARALTDQIKTGVEAVWQLITQAYTERAWDALGYASWDDYCTREFGSTRLRLPREERAEVVSSLRDSGLSIRAIAAATGVNRETIRQEIGSGDKKLPPEPVVDEDATTEQLIEDEPPVAPVIGIDGKRYQPARPTHEPVVKPRRRPLTETAADIVRDMEKLRGRINRLIDDDRFAANKQAIAGRLGRYEVWLSEAVARLHESLSSGGAELSARTSAGCPPHVRADTGAS